MTNTPLTVKLEKPCGACGYGNANLIRLHGSRFAVKCGCCDCYQYSVELGELKQGRAV